MDENEVMAQLEYLVARGEKSSVSEIARWAYKVRLDSLRTNFLPSPRVNKEPGVGSKPV